MVFRRFVGIVGLALLAACATDPPKEEEGTFEASARTESAIGVHRWSTHGGADVIEGYDATGAVVVTLAHAVHVQNQVIAHEYRLRAHDHGARMVFTMMKNAMGGDTFVLFDAGPDDDFSPAEILDRMKEDFASVSVELTTQASLPRADGWSPEISRTIRTTSSRHRRPRWCAVRTSSSQRGSHVSSTERRLSREE